MFYVGETDCHVGKVFQVVLEDAPVDFALSLTVLGSLLLHHVTVL